MSLSIFIMLRVTAGRLHRASCQSWRQSDSPHGWQKRFRAVPDERWTALLSGSSHPNRSQAEGRAVLGVSSSHCDKYERSSDGRPLPGGTPDIAILLWGDPPFHYSVICVWAETSRISTSAIPLDMFDIVVHTLTAANFVKKLNVLPKQWQSAEPCRE